ncbi:MAG: NAD(P)/FAD-dependent oxidoreductase [Solirubrobacteraceae bacterium]|nr:NAD(P)/FAD-dependent oxidoreductase [Solirubrobacteraceae bacterium]
MSATYDAIVVGARCAGSPTAMLLARKGYRVLAVDRATFPSDTMSTHIIHPRGVAALARWGLLERLHASGCGPIATYAFDFGPLTISGSPRLPGGGHDAVCPRRIVLDELLAAAAVEAGVELREGFVVDELVVDDDRVRGVRGHTRSGATVTERARIVIGADGRRSLVAKAVGAASYRERPALSAGYYSYWSGLPTDRFEAYIRPDRAFGVAPTHDGLTILIVNWPRAEFEANRKDVAGNCRAALELAPELAERVRDATRETRFVGTADLPNFFRQPSGPGWALVGDAGYHKDPITAQGISDAFRDGEAMADAVDEAFAGRLPMSEAMARYQRTRDASALPIYELTCEFATLAPPPPQMQQLLGAMHGNREAMNGFVGVLAGSVSPAAFFGPQNTARIMADATAAAAA